MRKVDSKMLLNLRKVSGLYDKALYCIRNGKFEIAESIAMEIEDLGYISHSSYIYLELGKAKNDTELVERAKSLIIPLAKELCANGYHLNEALHYRRLGMEREYKTALAEHALCLRSKGSKEYEKAVTEKYVCSVFKAKDFLN